MSSHWQSGMTDFFFKADDHSLYLYVWYPDESQPRYMIHMLNHSCTCKGWSIRANCKHIKEYQLRLEQVADKIKDMIILQ